ncbi:MAG: hypothetical protein ABI145_13545 [Steroidobacteraceae bacterium]
MKVNYSLSLRGVPTMLQGKCNVGSRTMLLSAEPKDICHARGLYLERAA